MRRAPTRNRRAGTAGHDSNFKAHHGAGAGAPPGGAARAHPGWRDAIVRRRVRDLRARQRRRHRRGAARQSRSAADLSRAQRAGHGARGHRLFEGTLPPADDGLHHLHRPGRDQLVTAAALAHVNRLPVLLLPGDVFVSRAPDPVLQQVEDFTDGTITANDCLRPVSRWFDRIVHPAQLQESLPQAIRVLTDAALCGPATLALPQDVQTDGLGLCGGFSCARRDRIPRAAALCGELARGRDAAPRRQAAADRRRRRGALCGSRPPRCAALPKRTACRWPRRRRARARCPGTIRCSWAPSASPARPRPMRWLPMPTSCSPSARGCPISPPDRTRCSRRRAWSISTSTPSTRASGAAPTLVGDARLGLDALRAALASWQADAPWQARARRAADDWRADVARLTGVREVSLPYDGDVIGAVQRSAADSPRDDIVVCAAGTLPAELHKLWRTAVPGGYHMEYGYSCMGYEIAGGLGVKMARPEREVVVMVGDGSYLMLERRTGDGGDARAQADRGDPRQSRLSAASTGCSRPAAASRSTTCSTTALRPRRARRASTSRRTRRRWARPR